MARCIQKLESSKCSLIIHGGPDCVSLCIQQLIQFSWIFWKFWLIFSLIGRPRSALLTSKFLEQIQVNHSRAADSEYLYHKQYKFFLRGCFFQTNRKGFILIVHLCFHPCDVNYLIRREKIKLMEGFLNLLS